MSKPRKRYDYVNAVDHTDTGNIEKRRAEYRRILRKLVREAVRERQKIHPTVYIDASDMIAERLVP